MPSFRDCDYNYVFFLHVFVVFVYLFFACALHCLKKQLSPADLVCFILQSNFSLFIPSLSFILLIFRCWPVCVFLCIEFGILFDFFFLVGYFDLFATIFDLRSFTHFLIVFL